QGPLEANSNAFTGLLRFHGSIRPHRLIEMPPWHVILATAQGQRALFSRAGLTELSFTTSETSWPAPSRLTLNNIADPRTVLLFLARRLSLAINKLRGDGKGGNRYFYVGIRA